MARSITDSDGDECKYHISAGGHEFSLFSSLLSIRLSLYGPSPPEKEFLIPSYLDLESTHPLTAVVLVQMISDSDGSQLFPIGTFRLVRLC